MTKGSSRISKRSFNEVPSKMVCCQSTEALNQNNDSMQKSIMLWYTSASNITKMNEEVLERWEKWRSEAIILIVLFCFHLIVFNFYFEGKLWG